MFVLHFLCCNVQQSRGLETGLSPVQGVLPNVKLIHNSRSNSGLEQITMANPYTWWWWWHGGFTSFRAWVCVTEVRVASGNSLTSRIWGQVFTFPGDEYVIRFELQAPYRWCQLECSKYRSVPCKETFNHLCKGSTCGNNSTKDCPVQKTLNFSSYHFQQNLTRPLHESYSLSNTLASYWNDQNMYRV